MMARSITAERSVLLIRLWRVAVWPPVAGCRVRPDRASADPGLGSPRAGTAEASRGPSASGFVAEALTGSLRAGRGCRVAREGEVPVPPSRSHFPDRSSRMSPVFSGWLGAAGVAPSCRTNSRRIRADTKFHAVAASRITPHWHWLVTPRASRGCGSDKSAASRPHHRVAAWRVERGRSQRAAALRPDPTTGRGRLLRRDRRSRGGGMADDPQRQGRRRRPPLPRCGGRQPPCAGACRSCSGGDGRLHLCRHGRAGKARRRGCGRHCRGGSDRRRRREREPARGAV
mmetsp:Transcript_39765/g.120146  ORF Transcript_39765/g.120146 Transcript_39765/m.120146 type:complete len:286 (+) Transcript_39765:3-860(+)